MQGQREQARGPHRAAPRGAARGEGGRGGAAGGRGVRGGRVLPGRALRSYLARTGLSAPRARAALLRVKLTGALHAKSEPVQVPRGGGGGGAEAEIVTGQARAEGPDRGREGGHTENMSVDSKKESFRNYLVSSGAVDALTKALVTLYEEPDKPGNSIEFFKNALGAPTKEEYDTLLGEKEALEKEVAELKAKVAELESPAEGAAEGEGEEAAEAAEAAAE